jgi:4-hydroxy-tetrahydrodipicolinate reductase
MSVTRVIIAGAAGRMGKALVQSAPKVAGISIVGAVEAPGHPALGQDAGTTAESNPIGVAITDDIRSLLPLADALIDFTLHTAVPINAKAAADARRAVVIGTTGLTEQESAIVMEAAHHVPILWAPNMSLGVNLLFAMSRKAAEVLGDEYVVQIDETHHVHKIDAPSGTALRFGEQVARGRMLDSQTALIHDPDGTVAPMSGRVLIRSHREGEVVGDHTVQFAAAEETIELTHHAWSRNALALGALKAAVWVVRQRPRLYDMQDMLGLHW